MALFAVIKGKIVDGIAIADTPLESEGIWIDVTNVDPKPAPGDLYVNGKFSSPLIENAPPVMVLNKLAMISRFTNAEYVGIVAATRTDPAVQAWYDMFQVAESINLRDQRTIDGVNFLASKNLITQERANEILTTPP